jgi:hypothetical protein
VSPPGVEAEDTLAGGIENQRTSSTKFFQLRVALPAAIGCPFQLTYTAPELTYRLVLLHCTTLRDEVEESAAPTVFPVKVGTLFYYLRIHVSSQLPLPLVHDQTDVKYVPFVDS